MNGGSLIQRVFSSEMRWCVLIGLLACGGGGEGQQCVIFSDCPSGQVCLMNVCTDLDGGTDGGDSDGAMPTDCGNGILDPGEQCDQGTANSDAPDTCRPTCTFPRCGDGVVDTGEECDDGNTALFDGCTPRCRVESAECAVVHSGNESGSSFSAVALGADGPGVARTLSTAHPHTEEVEHSITRCGSRIFAATDTGILPLDLRDGVPIAGVLEPMDDVGELACFNGSLIAIETSTPALVRFAIGETGMSPTDALPLPFEPRNQTRFVPFARGDEVIVVAVSERGGGLTGPAVARVSTEEGLTVAEMYNLGGSARGRAVDVSEDGRALLATTSTECPARWNLELGGSFDSACDIFSELSAETILSADPTGRVAWFGTGDAAVRLETTTWEPTRTVSGLRVQLLAQASSGFVAVGQNQLSMLSEPPSTVPMATTGPIRGVIIVPCAP